jgi:hypothetical protein
MPYLNGYQYAQGAFGDGELVFCLRNDFIYYVIPDLIGCPVLDTGESRGSRKNWMCSLASLTPPPFGRPAGVYPVLDTGRE